jgi:hypothetical protein
MTLSDVFTVGWTFALGNDLVIKVVTSEIGLVIAVATEVKIAMVVGMVSFILP